MTRSGSIPAYELKQSRKFFSMVWGEAPFWLVMGQNDHSPEGQALYTRLNAPQTETLPEVLEEAELEAIDEPAGMNVTRGGIRHDLDEDTAKRIIDHCARLGVAALSLTGGEPFLTGGRVFSLLDYARRAGIPSVRTGTNGFLFARPDSRDFTAGVTRLAEGLAQSRVRNFWISLDSAEAATHEAGRGLPGMVEGVSRALPILAAHDPFPGHSGFPLPGPVALC